MPRWLARRWGWGPLALALALAGAPVVHAEGRVRIAVLPVVVHSLEDVEYLRAGLADMLVSRLGRDARLAVIRVSDPAAATRDVEAARERARAEGAEWVVYGSFSHFGGGASLDLECVPVGEGDRRSVFAEATALGEIIPKLEPVAEKIARHVLNGVEPGTPGSATEAEVEALRRRVEVLERALAEARRAAAATPEEPPSAETPPSTVR